MEPAVLRKHHLNNTAVPPAFAQPPNQPGQPLAGISQTSTSHPHHAAKFFSFDSALGTNPCHQRVGRGTVVNQRQWLRAVHRSHGIGGGRSFSQWSLTWLEGKAAEQPQRTAEMQTTLETLITRGRSTPGKSQKNDVRVIRHPQSSTADKRHIPSTNRQGVPGIERTAKGRLWVVYGRDVESSRTFQVLQTSDDDGKTWSEVKLMILPRTGSRAMSANVWIDPLRRLWLFWGQSVGLQDGRYGVWAIMTDEPDAAQPSWTEPRRLGDGILLNKPTVLSNGDWLLPASVWKADHSCQVIASTDQGQTFQLRGTANVPDPKTRGPDEPMIVERQDGSLWMMVRVQGIAESFSQDLGKTWTPVARSPLRHPTSRFFLRRLNSGSLLLVKHGPLDERTRRERLMAYVSDDDGQSWLGGIDD